jgi:hypothetical protein
VLLPIGQASRGTRTRLVQIVGIVRGERGCMLGADEVGDEEVQRLRWLVKRTEEERDAALAMVAERDKTASVHQLAMPTLDAERMLAELADAVEDHWRAVSGKAPLDDWAGADERLKARKDTILLSAAPRLQAVA